MQQLEKRQGDWKGLEHLDVCRAQQQKKGQGDWKGLKHLDVQACPHGVSKACYELG